MKRKVKLAPPGGWRNWFELLPHPYSNNPFIVLCMIPMSWRLILTETADSKHRVAVTQTPKGTYYGLQVIDTALENYQDQRELFGKYDITMMDSQFTGRVDEIPNHLLLDQDRWPMAFARYAMWKEPINFKRAFKSAELKC